MHLCCLYISICLSVCLSVYVVSFLGRGVIDKPLKEVATFLRRVENNLSWDKFLIVSTRTDLRDGLVGQNQIMWYWGMESETRDGDKFLVEENLISLCSNAIIS